MRRPILEAGGEEEEGRVGVRICRLCVAVPSPPPLIPWWVPSWHRLWAVKMQIPLPSSCSCSIMVRWLVLG